MWWMGVVVDVVCASEVVRPPLPAGRQRSVLVGARVLGAVSAGAPAAGAADDLASLEAAADADAGVEVRPLRMRLRKAR